MSEQWWAVKRDGVFLIVEPTRRHADQEIVSHYPAPEQYSVVPVRIIEDAEPCEWEAERWAVYRIVGEYKTVCLGMRFCPMCGRSLEER